MLLDVYSLIGCTLADLYAMFSGLCSIFVISTAAVILFPCSSQMTLWETNLGSTQELRYILDTDAQADAQMGVLQFHLDITDQIRKVSYGFHCFAGLCGTRGLALYRI